MANGIQKDLGKVTAYSYAKAAGYTGTEEQFQAIFNEFTENAPGLIDRMDTAVARAEAAVTNIDATIQDAVDDAVDEATASAVATANQAVTDAQAAQTAAEGAVTQANNAVTQANAAVTAAQAAQSAAEDAAESFVLDRTLTDSGAAAPADLVGDLKESSREDFTSYAGVVSKQLKDEYILTRLTVAGTGASYALKGDGLSVLASGYTIVKFQVTPGQIVLVENTDIVGTNYASFQFQNIASVPATGTPNMIGHAFFDTTVAYIVPNNAAWLVTTVNNAKQNIAVYRIDARILGLKHINLFNPTNTVSGYINGVGDIVANNAYITSNFIDISDYEELYFSYTNMCAWYDSEKTFISYAEEMNSLSSDQKTTIPSNAVYLRVCGEPRFLNNIQVGENVNRNNYIPFSEIIIPHLKIKESDILKFGNTIVVDCNGNGDYTSLTEAVYSNIDNGVEIVVEPGEYDIIAEYKAFFGNDEFVNMSNSSAMNGFQNGIVLRNRKITFEPGSRIVCDWTNSGHDSTKDSNFSPFRIDYNVIVEGLYLTCEGCYYGIHDDYGINNPYTVEYKNCTIIGTNFRNINCIGGGCKKYSRHILKNCFFSNGADSSDLVLSADVRYHNTNAADAEPEVYVNDCYFSNNFNAAYYGEQTTKMNVYACGNYAPKGINKVRESSSMNTDNVNLYAWNNVTQ